MRFLFAWESGNLLHTLLCNEGEFRAILLRASRHTMLIIVQSHGFFLSIQPLEFECKTSSCLASSNQDEPATYLQMGRCSPESSSGHHGAPLLWSQGVSHPWENRLVTTCMVEIMFTTLLVGDIVIYVFRFGDFNNNSWSFFLSDFSNQPTNQEEEGEEEEDTFEVHVGMGVGQCNPKIILHCI